MNILKYLIVCIALQGSLTTGACTQSKETQTDFTCVYKSMP